MGADIVNVPSTLRTYQSYSASIRIITTYLYCIVLYYTLWKQETAPTSPSILFKASRRRLRLRRRRRRCQRALLCARVTFAAGMQQSRGGSTRVAVAPAQGIAVVAVDANARCSVRALLLLQACSTAGGQHSCRRRSCTRHRRRRRPPRRRRRRCQRALLCARVTFAACYYVAHRGGSTDFAVCTNCGDKSGGLNPASMFFLQLSCSTFISDCR